MKTKQNLLIVLFMLALCSDLVAQEKKMTNLKDFKIIIEKTNNKIKMKSVEGSAWVDLSFDLKDYQRQAVNQYGMTELKKEDVNKDNNLADFLFVITKRENKLELKGIKGMAWTELSFLLGDNKKQAINQFGMTSLN